MEIAMIPTGQVQKSMAKRFMIVAPVTRGEFDTVQRRGFKKRHVAECTLKSHTQRQHISCQHFG